MDISQDKINVRKRFYKMNKIIEIGFLGQKTPPELKTTQSGKMVATFTVSVAREYQKDKDKKEYDYFNCVYWGAGGEWLANNSSKIKMVCVEGSLETRHYEAKDGTKRYVSEIIVQKCEVTQWNNEGEIKETPKKEDKFQDMTPVDDGSIPFN